MKYLECLILSINDGVHLISVDETVNVRFVIQDAVIEPEARINPYKSMPVLFKGDLDDTIPYISRLGSRCPIRVKRPETMEYCGILQITFKLDDISDCYVEINREVV